MFKKGQIKVWIIVFAIIMFFAMLKVLNGIAKEKNMQNKDTNENVTEYTQVSNTIISGEKIPENNQVEFSETIKSFYQSCVDHFPDQAYDMLSTDVKRIYYPTLESFIEKYYNQRFLGNMKFSYQAWKTYENKYTYQVKIYENMLTTGKANNTYIEDYATIVLDNEAFKLNINGYISREQINKQANNDDIAILAEYVDSFMDYEIYTFKIKNNTNEKIILDTKKQTDSVHLLDEKDFKSVAEIFENSEEDLTLNPKETKEISIKFNDEYKTNVQQINFTNIVKESEYLNNPDTAKSQSISIKIK